MITSGIDIGSLSTKAVILDQSNQILGHMVLPTGGNNRETALKVFEEALNQANLRRNDIGRIIATGYGRENIPFADKRVTEITCHAVGIHFLFPGTNTIIDIGGQDTKGIQINSDGRVENFVMNDKCAAGTGRFLEVLANALGVSLQDLGQLSQQSTTSIKISSMCTVFAESEVVSLVAKGAPIPDIIRGIHDSIAERSVILLKKLNILEPISMSGGVAKNRGMVKALEKKLNTSINIPPHPQVVGALGAAIIAQRDRN
jgi:predicted CoA-substrate-specific enzyme activase